MTKIKIKKDKVTLWLSVVNSILIVVLLIWAASISNTLGGAIVPSGNDGGNEPTAQKIDLGVNPAKGSKNAKVVIVEFSDFECPFCARVNPALKQIEQEYGSKIAIYFRNFPLPFHGNAQKAAEAAQCANEQGKFWEMHDILFDNQQALDVASLKGYARNLGLDTAKFNDCLDSGKTASIVQNDLAAGRVYGVSGTPTFFINGKALVGAQPYSAFKQAIDAELAK